MLPAVRILASSRASTSAYARRGSPHDRTHLASVHGHHPYHHVAGQLGDLPAGASVPQVLLVRWSLDAAAHEPVRDGPYRHRVRDAKGARE